MSVRWYKKLIDGLLPKIHRESGGIVVCLKSADFNFTYFMTPSTHYLNFFTELPASHRCTFEVIFEGPQKIYFDLDLPEGMGLTAAQGYVREIVRALRGLLPGIEADDVMVFSSNGVDKLSYHIVVDRWCVMSCKDTRALCERVLERVSPECSSVI